MFTFFWFRNGFAMSSCPLPVASCSGALSLVSLLSVSIFSCPMKRSLTISWCPFLTVNQIGSASMRSRWLISQTLTRTNAVASSTIATKHAQFKPDKWGTTKIITRLGLCQRWYSEYVIFIPTQEFQRERHPTIGKHPFRMRSQFSQRVFEKGQALSFREVVGRVLLDLPWIQMCETGFRNCRVGRGKYVWISRKIFKSKHSQPWLGYSLLECLGSWKEEIFEGYYNMCRIRNWKDSVVHWDVALECIKSKVKRAWEMNIAEANSNGDGGIDCRMSWIRLREAGEEGEKV